MRRGLLVASALAIVSVPTAAQAFCGFYVGGADARLFNNATEVVLMREGTRTVLSMQNNYQGPAKDFALVVPVPVVLQKENVKTLPKEVFTKVDKLSAPRLVEYWEMDPCLRPPPPRPMAMKSGAARGGAMEDDRADHGVKIEAQFVVGEYEVVVLSAEDSLGLYTWLKENHYNIPGGAEAVLRPYVESGMKFFVAKVDIAKVAYDKAGRTMLSPLRFHYDSDTFMLPVRLGLLNSPGTQDLIVHILARGQRYDVANYPKATIPTNIRLRETAMPRFGQFYAALFDAVQRAKPGAVVTEYAWDSGTCDPCPLPPLTDEDLSTLGADVIDGQQIATDGAPPPAPGGGGAARRPPRPPPSIRGGFVLTRLHTRYGKKTLGDDLVFAAADPIVGGRETNDERGRLEQGAQQSSYNNFQGRYIVRHPWRGAVRCSNPIRGRWGGPPEWVARRRSEGQTEVATDLAFVRQRKLPLARYVRQDVPEIGLRLPRTVPKPVPAPPVKPAPDR